MGGPERASSPVDRDDPSGYSLRNLVEDVFLRPPAALLFIQSPLVGLGLWIPLFLTPSLAIVGLCALLFIAALDRFMVQLGISSLTMDFRANGFLAALASYWVLAPTGLSGFMLAVAVGVAVLVALYLVFLGQSLQSDHGLPVTVWPYCIVAAMVLTLFSGTGAAPALHFGWPDMSFGGWSDLPSTFLSALGVFVFSPSILSGAVIAVLIALWSPVMFLTGVIGWLSGALLSLALVSIGAMVDWVPASYNAFLAGMALGSIFIIPGWYGLFIASFAGGLASLVAAFLQVQTGYSGISYLPIPFIVTLYSGLVTMTRIGLVGRDFGAAALRDRPEMARISCDWLQARWGSEKSQLLGVPLRGAVEITQGMDGPLTHQGRWRHALDFQRPLSGVGTVNESRPSIWGEAVFSPVEGQVVSIQNTVRDNPVGSVNYGENWGNHVILRSDRQTIVAVCHLMAGSIPVQPGQRVTFDTQLGLVGNSGRSAMPHLHIQSQVDPRLGSPTKPFRLANYFEVNVLDDQCCRWRASGLPAERDIIAAASVNTDMHDLVTGMLPGRAVWTISSDRPGKSTVSGPFLITTRFTQDGLFRMESRDGDFLEAELDIDAFRVVSVVADQSGPIAALAIAMSTIPYAAYRGVEWEDALYLPTASNRRTLRDLVTPLVGAPLTEVALRLEQLSGAQSADITAKYRLRGKGRENILRLQLEAKRGPTRLSWEGPQGLTTMELVSFEVHAV